jgi:hypothetical protein
MDDLNDEWQGRVAAAMQRAAASGRGDVADYLRLRQANDEARETGIKWLLDVFTTIIGAAVRGGANLNTERTEPHRFPHGGSTMVGTRVVFRFGVRSLTIEAGYPRAPGDGFITGGGLAQAVIRHFGDARSGIELSLVRSAANELQWHETRENRRAGIFTQQAALRHIQKFLSAV